jgi:hypothetical protein
MRGKGERLEHAMVVYENVRMVLERLRDIDTELDAREFQRFDVTARAKEHLALAQQELSALAEIMQALHMRPVEDSSDNVLDTD